MNSIFYVILNRRGILYYPLFIGYLVFIHPVLIDRLAGASLSNPDPILGWAFLLASIFELIGFWLKYPIIMFYKRQFPAKSSNWMMIAVIFMPILHIGMSAFLFVAGTQIAGLQPAEDAAWYWQLLYVAGFFIILAKEGLFLTLFFSLGGMRWTSNQQNPPNILFFKRLQENIQEIQLNHLIQDFLGDVSLLIFSSLGYTALWEYIGMSTPFYTNVGGWELFVQLLGILIYFLMVIPPLQAIYIFQHAMVQTSHKQKIWNRIQFIFVLIAAYFSILNV